MQQTYRYRNIIIKPHLMQFVINELHLFVLTSVGFVYAGIDDAILSTLVFVLSVLLSLCLAYRMVYLCRMRYVISNEQLMFEHGVFHREVDYLELYRVVDFNESQNFLQQLFRLKTVSIYSGDRTTPRLDIIGVPMKEELVTAIRERVETNKRRRSIYENTNRKDMVDSHYRHSNGIESQGTSGVIQSLGMDGIGRRQRTYQR